MKIDRLVAISISLAVALSVGVPAFADEGRVSGVESSTIESTSPSSSQSSEEDTAVNGEKFTAEAVKSVPKSDSAKSSVSSDSENQAANGDAGAEPQSTVAGASKNAEDQQARTAVPESVDKEPATSTSAAQTSSANNSPSRGAIAQYAKMHSLGKVTGSELSVKGGASQTFQGGTVFWSSSTGAHAVRAGMLTKYSQLGFEQGLLGFPISDERRLSRDGGASQEFQNGQIHWSPAGAYFTCGAIQDYWKSSGWENGWLGYPTGDELQVRGGASQTFQGGTVFWSSSTGAHAVRAGMLTKYSQLGFEQGLLGFPISDERRLSRDGGASQEFQNGQIHWSPAGAYFTCGAIQDYWKSSGWENGWLGYPTGDELQVRGGASQTFQGGTVFWSSSTGAHGTGRGILAQYQSQKYEQGYLGFPTSEEYDWGKGRAQNFQHGRLEWNGCGKNGWQNPSQYFQVSSCDVRVPGSGKFAYASPSRIGMSASREQAIEAMISRAYDYMNTRYVWDYALRPGEGVDCAGLVMQSLYAAGMDLHEYNPSNHWYDPWHSHDANNMAADSRFKHVSLNERQRGDLIFWSGHVAIYLGNDQIIEANVPRVRTASLWEYGNSITAVARPFV